MYMYIYYIKMKILLTSEPLIYSLKTIFKLSMTSYLLFMMPLKFLF